MKRAALGAILVCRLAAQEASWTDEYPRETAAASKDCGSSDWTDCRRHLLRLKDLLDGRGDIIYSLARVEARLGNQNAALDLLALYSRMGLRLADPASEPAFAPWKNTEAFHQILERLRVSALPGTLSTTYATFPVNDLIPEDLAYDPVSGRFFASAVRGRKILALDRNGSFSDFVAPAEGPMMALAVDSRRRWLWATSDDEGKSAVFRYDLDSGKLLKRFDPPATEKHELGDMTLSPSGDTYISDGLGSIYQIDRGRDRLELLFGRGTFRSPQTPVVTPDGKRLFVPDYSRGISVVDLATKSVHLLPHPPELSLGGIDGLYLHGTTMVAIQNGTSPERLIRMRLDDGLTQIMSWETLEANWEGLGDPTHGVLVGDQFYFIANSGWDVKPGGTFTAPSIRRLTWK